MMLASGAFVTPAAAQENRFVISVNGGYQPTTNDFAQTQTFTVYVEQGSSTTRYDVPAGPLADVGVVVRLFSRFGAGVSGGG
ncbi:MAG: hypothetical protein HY654_02390, partial [Acidobacteria bacterium]|nr:hypothetical protein [Acidobacteriota bacterium]